MVVAIGLHPGKEWMKASPAPGAVVPDVTAGR
jgi:hypothetical protein